MESCRTTLAPVDKRWPFTSIYRSPARRKRMRKHRKKPMGKQDIAGFSMRAFGMRKMRQILFPRWIVHHRTCHASFEAWPAKPRVWLGFREVFENQAIAKSWYNKETMARKTQTVPTTTADWREKRRVKTVLPYWSRKQKNRYRRHSSCELFARQLGCIW